MRRSLTIALALIGLPIWVAVSPFWLIASILVDAVSGLWRFPTVRLSIFLGVYLLHTWKAVPVAGWLWLSGGFGRNPKLKAHSQMQAWWAESLLDWAGRLLGLHIEWPDTDDLPTDTFIILSRHASMIDAIVPAVLVAGKLDRFVHYVLKAELRWDPSLDIYGTRLGNYFVARSGSDPEAETEAIMALAQRAEDRSAMVIFPEGTYATPANMARVQASLERSVANSQADGADHLVLDLSRRLNHLLPPKPSGTLALFKGAPKADVVVLGHIGLEGVAQLSDLRRRLPLTEPVKLAWWVYDRDDVPSEPAEQVGWLNDRWVELDRWVSDSH